LDQFLVTKAEKSDFVGISNLPTTISGDIYDLPDEPIAIRLASEEGELTFLEGQAITYGNTAIIDANRLSEIQVGVLNAAPMEDASNPSVRVPELLLILERVPTGEGTLELTLRLIDGDDVERDAGERALQAAMSIEWRADGESASFQVKDPLTLFYIDNAECASEDGTGSEVPAEFCSTSLNEVTSDLIKLEKVASNLPAVVRVPLINLTVKRLINVTSGAFEDYFSKNDRYYFVFSLEEDADNLFLNDRSIGKVELSLTR